MIRFSELLSRIGIGSSHSAKSPHERLEQLETRSGYATLAIMAGIGIEIYLVIFVAKDHPWTEPLTILANVLIFVGLLVEFINIRKSIVASRAEKVAADLELAAANDRAAQAQTELREYRTPRRELMSVEARVQIIQKLEPFAGTKFDTALASGPAEVIHFCWDLEEVLSKANWLQLDWTSPFQQQTYYRTNRPLAGMVMADDVEIQLEPNHRSLNIAAATALVETLNSVGIRAKITDYLFANANLDAIHILVGPKL